MKLHTLRSKSGAKHRRKRVGRGNGSGMGTFSCKGMNGQNARSGGNRRPGFEGGQTSFISRMPKLKGFKNPGRVPFQAVNVKDLEIFDNGATVDVVALVEKGLVAKKNLPVKILGDGDLSKKLTVKVDAVSKSAEDKIKKAGGTCEVKRSTSKNNEKEKKADKKAQTEENVAKVKEEAAPAEEPANGASETSSSGVNEVNEAKKEKKEKDPSPAASDPEEEK